MEIYRDGNYGVTGTPNGRMFEVAIGNGQRSFNLTFYPQGAYETKFEPVPMFWTTSLRKQGVNPEDYLFCAGNVVRKAAAEAIMRAVADWQNSGTIPEYEEEPQSCERCGEVTDNPVWNRERFRGLPVQTPYCQLCAKLLRVAAGGIGVEGEPFTARDDDRTPYTKGDL